MAKILPFNDLKADHSRCSPLADEAREAARRVDAAELARLGAGVRARISDSERRSPRRGRLLSLAAAAAAIGIASLAVVSEMGSATSGSRSGSLIADSGGPEFTIEKEKNGSVVLSFGDSGRTHSVSRSPSPIAGTGRQLAVSPGERYVERRERSRPGTITYYRVN